MEVEGRNFFQANKYNTIDNLKNEKWPQPKQP